MLTGADLLTKVKELGDVSKTDLATACGYVSKKKMAPIALISLLSTRLCSTLRESTWEADPRVLEKGVASSPTSPLFKAMATC